MLAKRYQLHKGIVDTLVGTSGIAATFLVLNCRETFTCVQVLKGPVREPVGTYRIEVGTVTVGAELGISEITVKAHRGQLMRKMQADSLAGLVTMSARLNDRQLASD